MLITAFELWNKMAKHTGIGIILDVISKAYINPFFMAFMVNKNPRNNVSKGLCFGLLVGIIIMMTMSTSNTNYGLQKSMAQTEPMTSGQTAKPTLNSAGLPLIIAGNTVKPFGKPITVKSYQLPHNQLSRVNRLK